MARNEIYFRISFAVSVLLAMATLVAAFLSRVMGAAWVPAAFGISTAGAVVLTMNAVREKHSFDVMLELATGLDEKAVRQVLQVLLKKYLRPAPEPSAVPKVGRRGRPSRSDRPA
jgi:hypothetical protein